VVHVGGVKVEEVEEGRVVDGEHGPRRGDARRIKQRTNSNKQYVYPTSMSFPAFAQLSNKRLSHHHALTVFEDDDDCAWVFDDNCFRGD